jgi:hypothetical protein
MNEHDWILEAFIKIVKHLSNKQKEIIINFAQEYENYPRKKTQDRVNKLKDLCRASLSE